MGNNIKAIAIFCGSRETDLPLLNDHVGLIARELVEREISLVYGGSSEGVMGLLAGLILEYGGNVTGVIPRDSGELKNARADISEIVVVDSTIDRKEAMLRRSDAAILLPGGIGAVDEFFSSWMAKRLGFHNKPLAILNTAGFYDHLLSFLEVAKVRNLIKKKDLDALIVGDDPIALLEALIPSL